MWSLKIQPYCHSTLFCELLAQILHILTKEFQYLTEAIARLRMVSLFS